MKIDINKFLDELKDETFMYVGNVNDMAQYNMFIFPINIKDINNNNKDTIISKLEYSKDICKQKWGDKNHIFYCWIDEMAGQIRFSTIPTRNRLPFSAKLKFYSTIQELVILCIHTEKLNYLKEISFEEAFDDLGQFIEDDIFEKRINIFSEDILNRPLD